MLKLKMRLDGKITSVNKIYCRNRHGGVFLAPEVVKYREDQKPIVKQYLRDSGTHYEGGLLVVVVDVCMNFFTKGHEIKRLDLDNFAKNILDTIFPPMGIDDKAVFDLRLRKVQYDKGQPYIIVKITEHSKGDSKKAKSRKAGAA